MTSLPSAPLIEWVNHASYLLQSSSPARLITDPWLFGSAFNDGWDLISESKFQLADFEQVTHIWFSHEHPDHFAPNVLRALPLETRQKITVLFQKTSDQKLLQFCQGLGFQTQELEPFTWVELAPQFRLLCGTVPFYDSWLLCEVDGVSILNVNDCVLDRLEVLEQIEPYLEKLDVLLTQFGYANWIGNPHEAHLRRASAAEKLQRIDLQIEKFKPTFVIPFASFIYFSHQENSYLNDEQNRIDLVHERIQEHSSARSIVLYPGDRWQVGAEWKSQEALARYHQDSLRVKEKTLRTSESVAEPELMRLSSLYLERVYRKNSTLLIRLLSWAGILSPLLISLQDLQKNYVFDLRRGLRVATQAMDLDKAISMHSSSLAFLLKFEFGMDTLSVNGRFRARESSYRKLIQTFSLGSLNNTGRALKLSLFFDRNFVRRAASKMIYLTRGRLVRSNT